MVRERDIYTAQMVDANYQGQLHEMIAEVGMEQKQSARQIRKSGWSDVWRPNA
jgi:hypothetical protein